jgi:hypothetical protein
MTADHHQEFLDTMTEVSGSLPPVVVAVIDQVIDAVVARLGESPEAWRGAIEVITLVMKAMMMGREDPDDPVMLNVNETMIGLIISTLAASPWSRVAMNARAERES